MENVFALINEVEETIEYIKTLKDKALEHYQENKKLANKLLLDLNNLEDDANKLLDTFKSIA